MADERKLYSYKNVSDLPQVLIGVGEVKPNGIIKTYEVIDNVNFELVERDDSGPIMGVEPRQVPPTKQSKKVSPTSEEQQEQDQKEKDAQPKEETVKEK